MDWWRIIGGILITFIWPLCLIVFALGIMFGMWVFGEEGWVANVATFACGVLFVYIFWRIIDWGDKKE